MYSGIVEGVGCISQITRQDYWEIVISAQAQYLAELNLGDSIGVNGVCLTVVSRTDTSVTVHVVPETLSKTTLALIKVNDLVNLERPLRQNARNGGHYVQGHIDGMGTISHIEAQGEGAVIIEIKVDEHIAKYLVDKGFVAIDGMSITVIKAQAQSFTVTLIPYTQAHTIAKQYRVGSTVNIEADFMGKYIEKYVQKFLGSQTHGL